MGTTADKLNKLLETKANIKQALIDKGVDIADDTKFADYPAKIESIIVGDSAYEIPNFFEIVTKNNTDYSYLFYYKDISKISSTISTLNTGNVTAMNHMFSYSAGTTLDLSSWDMSNVTKMDRMFAGCSLTSLDLSNFNIEKAKDFSDLFYNCSKLASIDVSRWNTSNVTSMYCTFQNCSSLTTLDLSSWDTRNVTNMNYMFNNCNKLITIIGELDASSLTNGFFPGASTHAFGKCTSLEAVYIKNIYKNCAMTNASKWSINLGDTKVKDECLIYTINELPDLINNKGLTATDKIVFTLPPTNTLTEEQVQVAIDKGWNVANTTY